MNDENEWTILTAAEREQITRCIDKHGGVCREVMCDDSLDSLIDSIIRGRVKALEAERDTLRRGGAALGDSLVFWLNLAVEVTGSEDCIDDDGDGDYGVVAERLAAMKPRTRPVPTADTEATP